MAVKSLKVLVLEDRVEDLELILHTLKKSDYDPIWKRVENGPDFRSALAEDWDVILSDYTMPIFNAPAALEILQQQGRDTPFLVITGSISEEVAVDCLKRGAADYLLKDRLTRLGTAVAKALQDREARRLQREQEAAVRESEERFRQLAVELQTSNQALEQKAIALREVVNMVQEDKRVAQRIMANRIETTVLPMVQLAKEGSPSSVRTKLEQLERNLTELTSPFMNQLAQRFASLTPSETRICQLLRRGLSSKEIANIEGVSPDTVDTHRRNIRRKLNIASEQVNLVTFLQSLDSMEK